MTMVVECTHSTVKLLNVHIQWPLAIECVDSMDKLLNVHIQWLSTFNTTYICVCEAKVEQKKVEYLCYSFECILFSFTFFHFT